MTALLALFTGEQFDTAVGGYYLRARWTDAENGRFLSRDDHEFDFEHISELARYSYAANNPILNLDPSGYSFSEYSIQLKTNFEKHKAVLLKCFQATLSEELLTTGIYLLLTSINPYIGQSRNVPKRVNTHIAQEVKKVMNSIQSALPKRFSKLQRERVEQAMIDTVKDIWGIPLQNKVHPLGPQRASKRIPLDRLKQMLKTGACP